jgi:hypothetical protein
MFRPFVESAAQKRESDMDHFLATASSPGVTATLMVVSVVISMILAIWVSAIAREYNARARSTVDPDLTLEEDNRQLRSTLMEIVRTLNLSVEDPEVPLPTRERMRTAALEANIALIHH